MELNCLLHTTSSLGWCTTFSICARVCRVLELAASNKIAHFFVIVGLFFLLPLAVTIFTYRKVSRKIQEHNINLAMTHQSQRRDAHFSAHEIRISKSLFVVVFAFMLCWVPAWLITILAHFVGKVPRNIQLLCAFLVNLSNAINPFIYAGMNPLFKLEFTRILHCAYYKKTRNESGSNADYNQQGSSQRTVALVESTRRQFRP